MKQTKLGKFRVLICILLSLCMVFALTACDKDSGGGSFKLNSAAGTVDVGKTLSLMASGNGSDAVEWISSDENVATVALVSSAVTTAARVTGVAVGTATITATAGGKTATCIVTVTNPETIAITKDGAAVTAPIQLSKNGTVQLAATSSKGHSIAWESSSDLIATVSSTGLVTAVATSGTATITAKCGDADNSTNAIKSTVTVSIGSGVDSSYTIVHTEAKDIKAGVWAQWSEFKNVNTASYNDGEVMIDFSNNGARWVNIQLRYFPTESDGLISGQVYKLEFDADLEFHEGFEAANGHATVNGNVVTLTAGKGHYTVYYKQSAAAFDMLMGWDDGTASGAWDLIDAKITLSNITWTKVDAIPLVAPSFSITQENIISITDTNPANSVGCYVLTLYNESNKIVGQTIVVNNKPINTSKITTNGTFTAKLKAIAKSDLYKDSPEATSDANTVKVDNDSVSYDLAFTSGVSLAGEWYYWSENWVAFTQNHYDGATDKVTASFSNNQGNWYDTQFMYKSYHAVGETYSVTFHINVTANNIGDGKVTINDVVHNLVLGDNEITLNITEGNGASIVIVFGVVNGNNAQDIKAATVTLWVTE